MRINDTHIHIGYSPDIMRGLGVNALMEFKKQNEIENMLLFPFHNDDQNIIDKQHINISGLHQIDKGIKGLYWFNKPLTHDDLKALFERHGFVGLKYHGAFTNKPITDQMWKNTLLWLDVMKGILLVHCGMFKEGHMESNTSFYHALLIANQFRNIKVILGHAGGSILPVIKKCCEYAKDVPNVWLETSGVSSPVSVDYIANTIGVSKILFGSDAPWCSFKSQLYNVLDCNLPDSKKDLILYYNFMDMIK